MFLKHYLPKTYIFIVSLNLSFECFSTECLDILTNKMKNRLGNDMSNNHGYLKNKTILLLQFSQKMTPKINKRKFIINRCYVTNENIQYFRE